MRRSIFDSIESEAIKLFEDGWSIRKVYKKIKDKIAVETSFTGFYYYAKRRDLIIKDSNL